MIGKEIHQIVFRDTKTYYHSIEQSAIARQLMRFARRYCGPTVLDLGCATGNYSLALMQEGYSVKSADVNGEYISIARSRGIDAYEIKENVPFADRTFDTVICFEVIEHVEDIAQLLKEARRLAKKNVLISTPNSECVEELIQQGLLFEHFAELDHRNFFTQSSLESILREYFPAATVFKGDGINPFALFGSRWIRWIGKAMIKSGLFPTYFHFRLYAVCSIQQE